MNSNTPPHTTNKASLDYWNREYRSYKFHIAKKKDFIRRWIEAHIPAVTNKPKTCLEVGCYPGRFISVFGRLGYELHGIDLVDEVEQLSDWLTQSGYKVGSFSQCDFNEFKPQRKYDVVCSFGFIEHFTNWEQILTMHASLVADKGILVVEAPNFVGGFQHWLHSRFDEENYARHHIPAMNIEQWAQLLENRGFEISYAGYFGKFRFWTEPQARTIPERLLLRSLRMIQPVLRALLPLDRKMYSPFCGVIARRRQDPGPVSHT